MEPRYTRRFISSEKLRHFLARRDSAAFTTRQGCIRFLTAVSIWSRHRCSAHNNMASSTASSSRRNRPVSMAWRIKASWSGDKVFRTIERKSPRTHVSRTVAAVSRLRD